jgi:hypothetical protein
MSERDYSDAVDALRRQHPDLAEQVARFTGITGVLAWMREHGLARGAVDIVGQDEFHYDFLVELERGGHWIAFGVT